MKGHKLDLAQDRDRWLDLAKTVMNLGLKMRGIFCLVEELFATQEGLSSMEVVT